MNKTVLIVITIALAIGIGFVLFGHSNHVADSTVDQFAQNVEIRDGVQYVGIQARGGYSPRVSTAQAYVPTKLVVETNGTYDCSATLVIRSIDYQKTLPMTGEEVIDLGTPSKGSLQGTCGMGMYGFTINFE